MKHVSTAPHPAKTTMEDIMKNDIITTEAELKSAPESETNHGDNAAPDTVVEPPSVRSKSKKNKMAQAAEPAKATAPEVRILKVTSCPSLSGRSELTYHVGCIGNAIQLRVYGNSGKGYFNQEWIAYSAIADLVTSHEEFSAGTLRSIFVGKSVNTAGFFMAVLKDLGLIETSKTNQRFYTHSDSASFENQTGQLIASGVAVEVAERDTSPAGKKGTLKPKL